MRAAALDRLSALSARELSPEDPSELVDAVNALLFGLTVIAPTRVPVATPIELACLEAAEAAASLDSVSSEEGSNRHVSARALDRGPANDGASPYVAGIESGPSASEVEALVRLAAARCAAPAAPPVSVAARASLPLRAAQPAAEPTRPLVVPALLSAHTAQVTFGEGGADAMIEVAHPVLGPIRLEVSMSAGGVGLRALTPSTTTAIALRALEPAIARALATRGLSFRSLRVDVGSDSRASQSRTARRRTDFEEEA
jgi:hypothetical protein